MYKKRQNNIKDMIFKNDFWAIIVMFIIVLCQLFLSKDKANIDLSVEFLKITPILFTCNRNRLRVLDMTADKSINSTLKQLIAIQIISLIIYLSIPILILFKGITIDNTGLITFSSKIFLLNKIQGMITSHYYLISAISQTINVIIQSFFIIFNKVKDDESE